MAGALEDGETGLGQEARDAAGGAHRGEQVADPTTTIDGIRVLASVWRAS